LFETAVQFNLELEQAFLAKSRMKEVIKKLLAY